MPLGKLTQYIIYMIYVKCMNQLITSHIYIYICIHNYITSFLESYMYHVEIDSTIVPMPTTTLLIDKSLPGGSLWGCSSGGGGERTGFATLWFGIPLGSSNGWGMVRARWFRERSEWKEGLNGTYTCSGKFYWTFRGWWVIFVHCSLILGWICIVSKRHIYMTSDPTSLGFKNYDFQPHPPRQHGQ